MPRKTYKVNHKRAWCYFVGIGRIPVDAKKNEWCLHHKDTTLKSTNPARYNEWNVEDLEPMLKSEHTRLHQLGRKQTTEQCKAKSIRMKGRTLSEETRRKISEKCKGRKIPEDEIKRRVETYRKNHPKKPQVPHRKSDEDKGKFWITNGVENRRISLNTDLPEGWWRGRLGFKRSNNPRLGPMSDEHKMKISKARLGMKFSDEHRKHLSESHKRGNDYGQPKGSN